MIRGGKMDYTEQIALGNGRSKFIVDIDLPDAAGNLVKLRSYYDPLKCEIVFGCTFFSVKGVWQEATMPDWALWDKHIWQDIMRSRQASVCMSMGHPPCECPNEQYKPNEAYDHKYYEQDK